MAQVFRVRSEGVLPETATVRSIAGVEAMSRPYTFSLRIGLAAADAAGFDPAAAIDRAATFEVMGDDDLPRFRVHGVWASFERVHTGPTGSLFAGQLVPRLARLALTRHGRVWVGRTLEEILDDVMRLHGLRRGDDYVTRFTGRYRALDHVCQYDESDLDFLARRLERDGVFYFFEHDGDAERIVFADHAGVHVAAGDPVRFFPTGALDESGVEGFERFTALASVAPREARVDDHNPHHPELELAHAAPIDGRAAQTVATFGEHAPAPDVSRRLARMRAERWAARRTRYTASGRVTAARAGFLFTVEHHPRHRYNATYLATEVRVSGDQLAASAPGTPDRTWLVEVEAIAASTVFRPAATTPWPRMQGLERAVVDGPAESDYAQLDAHGRYLVRLRFDENAHAHGAASTRLRMVQPHAGEPEGMHLPLRRGTEVMVAFLGGDPDQPVLVGAAPDAAHPSPVTSANATQNVIHTGANNRIEIDDDATHPYIDLYSPPKHTALHLGEHHPHGYHGGHDHHFVLTTDGDGLVHTGDRLDVTVGGEKRERVQKHVEEAYDATQTTTVAHDVTERYGATQTTTVTAHGQETFGSHTTTVNRSKIERVGSQDTTVTNALVEQHGVQVTSVANALTVRVGTQALTAWGVSVQRYGSLSVNTRGGTVILSPAGIELTAPNLRIAAPTVTAVHGDHSTAAPSHKIFEPISTDTTSYKMGVYANATQITMLMKGDAVGAGIAYSDLKIDQGAIKNECGILRAKTKATKSVAAGAKLWRFGLIVVT